MNIKKMSKSEIKTTRTTYINNILKTIQIFTFFSTLVCTNNSKCYISRNIYFT